MQQFSEDKFDQHFRSTLEDYRVKPSGRSWRVISDYLNIQRDKKKRLFLWFIASSFLLVGGVTFSLLNSENISKKYFAEKNSEMNVQQLNLKPISPQTTAVDKIEVVALIKSDASNRLAEKLSLNNTAEKNSYPSFRFTKIIAQGIDQITNLSAGLPKILNADKDFNPDEIYKKEKKSRLTFGIIAGINNSWIADRKTFENPDYSSRFTLNALYGIKALYSLSNLLLIEGDIIYMSEGQKYKMKPAAAFRAIDVYTQQKEIKFSYLSIPVLIHFRSIKNNSEHPVYMDYLFGASVNLLANSSIPVRSEMNTDPSLPSKTTYSVMAGIEYNIPVLKKYSVSLGARTSYGTNSFSKPAYNNDFSRPHIFSAGINTSFNFSP